MKDRGVNARISGSQRNRRIADQGGTRRLLAATRGSHNAKRFAATALVLHVRVVELEAFVQPFACEVEFGAVEIGEALRIDNDLHAVALEHLVFGREFVHILELVREARAAGRAHAQAQPTPLPRRSDTSATCCAAFSVNVIAIVSRLAAARRVLVTPCLRSHAAALPCIENQRAPANLLAPARFDSRHYAACCFASRVLLRRPPHRDVACSRRPLP